MAITIIQNPLKYQQDFFTKFNFMTVAIDLRGFGKNPNAGQIVSLENHIYDLKKRNSRLKKSILKKIFLLGKAWEVR